MLVREPITVAILSGLFEKLTIPSQAYLNDFVMLKFDLPRVYNGLGISIISTPSGVMSDYDARKANVGGEILCQVF